MSYGTIMVHLDLDAENDARLQLTRDLAERFGSTVIGIAAGEYRPTPYYIDSAFVKQLMQEERDAIGKRLDEVEASFKSALQGTGRPIEWRGELAKPTEHVIRAARAADLVITGPQTAGLMPEPFRTLDVSEVVMQAGRPVLMTPASTSWLAASHALIAWKDTREARRAVSDALPLLHKAKEVSIVSIIEETDEANAASASVDDVAAWLKRHGIGASARIAKTVDDAAIQLQTIAAEAGADLIVAGAYGHNRFREWVFGGVTESFLTECDRCVLLAH